MRLPDLLRRRVRLAERIARLQRRLAKLDGKIGRKRPTVPNGQRKAKRRK